MKRNDLFRKDDSVLRVIHVLENRIMVIDCMKCTMPVWMNPTDMCSYVEYAEYNYYSDVSCLRGINKWKSGVTISLPPSALLLIFTIREYLKTYRQNTCHLQIKD